MKKFKVNAKSPLLIVSVLLVLLSAATYSHFAFSTSYDGPQTKQEQIADNEMQKAIFFETCGDEFGDEQKFMNLAKKNLIRANRFVTVEKMQEMYPFLKKEVAKGWDEIPDNQKLQACVAASMAQVFQ